MPNYRRWNGGATAVAQVKTIQFTTSTAADEVTVTMTAEDGSTQAVTHTVADAQVNHLAAAIQSACNSSSLSLFQQVTFTVDTDTVTVTAKMAGRPFTLAVTDDGTTAYTVADPTANAGPNDWNTAANWSGSTVPVSDDLVVFSDGSFDVLYGLDQSSVALYQMSVARGYTGNIGTLNAALHINTDATDAAAEQSLNLAGNGYYYNIKGDFPIVNVSNNRSTLKIAGEISETDLVGTDVSGNITIDSTDSTTDGNAITISNVGPACLVTIPSTATNTGHIRMDSGRVLCSASTKSAKSSLLLSGNGVFETLDSGVILTEDATLGIAPAPITILGGTYIHRSDADLSGENITLAIYNGRADFSRVRAKTSGEFLDLGTVELYGGVIDQSSSGNLTSFTSLIKAGGTLIAPASSITTAAKR